MNKILRWTIPSVVVAAAWLVAAVLPTGGTTSELRENVDQTRTQLIGVEQANEGLRGFAETEQAAASRISQIREAIPPTAGIADLIEMLAVLSAEHGLELGEISPSPTPQAAVTSDDTEEEDGPLLSPEELESAANELALAERSGGPETEALSQLSIDLRGSGPYQDVLAFVDDLSRGRRLIATTSFDLRPDDGGQDFMQFSIELIAFTTAAVEAPENAGPSAPAADQLDLRFEEDS